MKDNQYTVAGYGFTDLQEYKTAKREVESIEYIRANTDFNDRDKVAKLYYKLVSNKTFKTIVGYGFLKELQERILKDGVYVKDSLPCIPVEKVNKQIRQITETKQQKAEIKDKDQADEYRIRYRNSVIINIFLVIIILGMIVISLF